MSTENILVERSQIGEISIYDRTDKFVASFKDGRWLDEAIFDFDYLEQNFTRITNEDEVLGLVAEARAALAKCD
jgi:hypothetical protein